MAMPCNNTRDGSSTLKDAEIFSKGNQCVQGQRGSGFYRAGGVSYNDSVGNLRVSSQLIAKCYSKCFHSRLEKENESFSECVSCSVEDSTCSNSYLFLSMNGISLPLDKHSFHSDFCRIFDRLSQSKIRESAKKLSEDDL